MPTTKYSLSELQLASRIRHDNPNQTRFSDDLWDGFLYELEETKDIVVRKEKRKRSPRKYVPESKKRHFIEAPVVPDKKNIIVRPPAIYSNSSPYGIADELLRGK